MAVFHHVGVPTKTRQPNEIFIAGGKVHITDASAHPYRFEHLRFEPDSPMPEILKNRPHIAYMVDDLSAALAGEEVILQPFDATPELRVAFIVKDGMPVEVMQAI